MALNSVPFFLYFLTTLLIFHLVSYRWKWIVLLLGSYIFYAIIDIRYIALLAASTLLDYYITLYISPQANHGRKKFLLWISLFSNIATLFAFKYIGFFGDFAVSLLDLIGVSVQIPHINIITPLGISFFIFKKMSYVIDVYRGDYPPEESLGYFALYVSFFLEILAGPIDRARNLIPQIKNNPEIRTINFNAAFMLILWGLFLKVVVADRLSLYTDAIFNNVNQHSGPSLIIAAYFYTFQIYCDFAGYTNIVLGCGKLLGINLMENFNLPYHSQSISEFWRRWHMTLSYWLRDYLYIPLGGNRVSVLKRCINYLVIFILCGLWHGANFTFVVWGSIHGFFLITSLLSRSFRESMINFFKLPENYLKVLRIFITFHLVTFAWIFFRANTLQDAWMFIARLITDWGRVFIDSTTMVYGILGIVVVLIIDTLRYRGSITLEKFTQYPAIVRWPCYYILIFAIIIIGVESNNAFIYYQF